MKRIISIVLCLSMLLSMLPMGVFAADVEEPTSVTETASETLAPENTEAPVEEPTEEVPEETDGTEAASPETTGETEALDIVTEDAEAAQQEEPAPIEFTWFPEEDLPDSDELFAGFVEQTFYGKSAAFGTAAGSRLTGDAKVLYDGLRPMIEEIASGQRSSATLTVFGDFTGNTVTKKMMDDIFLALLADMPYEMYWFDKTNGVGGSYMPGSNSLEYVTLYFSVSPHYSADGTAGTFDLDTSKTGAAAAAANNARDIVAEYESKGDYEKLLAYKDKICLLTDYNDAAARPTYSNGYGDPWQLIWVFDGKSNTKVVCEGYAKAFQFLCDLSDFDADITSYNVQGYMNGGGHMWNIVSINGSNYLVDVTNCELGTIGYSNKLFLVGGSGSAESGYTFVNALFTYDEDRKTFWGTGANSILTLASSNFDPDSLTPSDPEPEPDVSAFMTGEELQAALNAASGQYFLEKAAVITNQVTVPQRVSLTVYGDASITVQSGGSLTISRNASLGVANGGTLTVEQGGSLVNNGSFAIGGGTVCTIAGNLANDGNVDVNYGTLDITGTYTAGESSFVRKDTYGTINGIETHSILLYSYVFDEDQLEAGLVPNEDYNSVVVFAMANDSNGDNIADAPFTISRNLTVPEGVQLQLGYFMMDNTQFVIQDGVILTVEGIMNVNSMSTLTISQAATLINHGFMNNAGTIVNNGRFLVDGEFNQNGTYQGNDAITGNDLSLELFLANVAAAEASGDNLVVWDEITLKEDLTINMTGELSFADYAKLTVSDGVTLTVNGPISFNHSNLVVEAGGTLISNTALSINDHLQIGATATIDGELLSRGEIWVNSGAVLNLNGYAEICRNFHVGFGENGQTSTVNVAGLVNVFSYMNLLPNTGELNIAGGGKVSICGPTSFGGMDFGNETFETIGSLQACGVVNVDGELEILGYLTLGGIPDFASELNVGTTGLLFMPAANMRTDIAEGGILTNEGSVINDGILNIYGTVSNYASFVSWGQIRLFGTGSYEDFNGAALEGNVPTDGVQAQLDDFLNDLADGQGATLYNTVTLEDNLTIDLGQDHVLLTSGAELIVPDGVTLTVNSHVRVEEAIITVEEGGTLILNTNLDAVSMGALGYIAVHGRMVINDGAALWLDQGAVLDIFSNGVVDVIDDPTTEAPAAIHVSNSIPGGTVWVEEGTLNTSGYVAVHPGGYFKLWEDGTLNILNNTTGCGYLDVAGIAQLYGTVKQDGLMSVSNNNGTDDFVPETARIEVYGTMTASDTSTIFINPNADISVAPSGILETDGEVRLEADGTLWVDGDATLSGSVTSYGNIHANHFPDDSDYNGCLIIDGEMTNYGYINVAPSGTMYVDGTLTIDKTMVEEQGFAGYLNNFGNVIVNGTINNYALMDTHGPGSSGYLQINSSGTVNVNDNIAMAVCNLGSLILDGTLNIAEGSWMEVYGDVSGYGNWNNCGTVHFGVSTDPDTGDTYAGSCSFDGWYEHGMNASLEVALYEGEPIAVDLIPTQLQTLICFGSNMDDIRTVLANTMYRTQVIISEEAVIDSNLVIGSNASMNVQIGAVITQGVTVTAYGPIQVDGALTVNGTLKLYHPNGTLSVLENGNVTVNGTVFNGTSTTVHGQMAINGTWEGYAPAVAGTGSVTGTGAPSAYDMFLTLIREAAAGGYPAVLTRDLTIPAYTDLFCDLIVEEGVTLTLDGNLAVWGSLTMEEGSLLVNNGGLSREDSGAITFAEGTYSGNGPVYNACNTPESYALINGLPTQAQSLLVMMCTTEEIIRNALSLSAEYKDTTLLVRHNITLSDDLVIPQGVTLRLYRDRDEDGHLIPANFTIPQGVTVTNNGTFQVSDNAALIINGDWSGNAPQANGGTIEGDYTSAVLNIQTKVQPSFFENSGEPGLWAGAKTSFSCAVTHVLTGEELEDVDVTVSFSEGAENYAKIQQKDGLVTVTANSDLASHQVITATFTADSAVPVSVNLHLRPKASAVNVLLNGTAVTNQTILADLNRGDTSFQLSASGAPGDAVPETDTLPNGKELVTWKSSVPAIATVDENGTVTMTGEKTGKVKITMSANYGAAKTAVVTFNVVALPRAITPADSNPTAMVGGSAGTFSVADEHGTVLKSSAVCWYLSDEAGIAISTHPYASVTAAGKLTTKPVAYETNVYLMAKVIGDEQSAELAEPVCVTLYPAVEYARILVQTNDITGQTLPFTVDAEHLTAQLDWDAGPYVESVRSVSWKSSKPAVASINDDGLITVASANASGSVKFTLTVIALNGKKTIATVTLNFGVFTTDLDMAVTLPDGTRTEDLNGLTVYGGDSLTFEASCIPENVTTNGVLFSLDSKTYGSITSKGVLKTKVVTNPTEINVFITSKDGFGYKIPVILLPKPVSTESGTMAALVISNDERYLTKTTCIMKAGTDMQLYANAENVVWNVSNANVATVTADGILTALTNGTATITATADGRSASFTLKVDKLSEYVEITTKKGEPFTLASGKNLDLVGTVTYSDGSSDKKVTWSMEFPNGLSVPKTVATLSSSGKLAAAKGLTSPTRVRIFAEAKDGNPYGYTFQDVTIVPATTAMAVFGPDGADITNTTLTHDILTGTEFALSVRTFPVGAMDLVTWKSSAPKVAAIDNNGKVTCLKSGTATITATAGDGSGKKVTFKLNVVKTMEYLQLPKSAVVGGGKSLTFAKLAGYSVDPLATNQTLNWILTYRDGSAVPASVASLSKGVLKTKAVTAPVTLIVRAEATDSSGCADECIVTVCPITKSVAITNVPAQLSVGRSIRLNAVCEPDGAAQGVTWKSSSDSIATVDDSGLVTGIKPGNVTITATAADGSGKKATAKITVVAAPAGGDPEDGTAQISMIAAEYSDASRNWWANFVREFEAANPNIDLTVDVVSWNDIYTVVNTRIATGQAPDILNIDIFEEFQADGLLLPIQDYLSEETSGKFYPQFLEESRVNGQIWAVPDLTAARAMYYNTDILAAAGVNVPTTWNELVAACEAIKDYNPNIYPWGVDMTTDEGQASFAYYIWNNGGDFVDSRGNWKLNSEENIEAIEFIISMVESGLTNSDPLIQTRYDLQDMFSEGQVAMMIAPCTSDAWMSQYGVNFAIAPIPTNTNTSVALSAMDRMMCFDNNYNTAELEAITTFFDFFYEDQRYTQWVQTEGFLPATSSGCRALAAMNPSQAIWGEVLESVKFYPSGKADWYEVKLGAIDVLQRALLGENVRELLDTLQSKIK